MGRPETILGIDIGPNSIGWAFLQTDGGMPKSLPATGVRVFEGGLADMELDGKGKSRNVQRREARLRRRQTERRVRRRGKLARLLQRAGLLPSGDVDTPEGRHSFFSNLDKTMAPPYSLRARALDEGLSPHELGRALYHLGQRRGFLSNRKTAPKKDEDAGKVRAGIGELEKNIQEAGARTLGEHFAKLDPEVERIRGRYTSRKMYQEEFEKIWEAQKAHHPKLLTDDLKKEIKKAIFYQRPLKSQKSLIGRCSLEKGKRRAPWALLSAQRFRYMQKLNDLLVVDTGTGEIRPLDSEERKTLIDALETGGDITFAKARRLLKLPKGSKFNLEEGGEKRMPGNRTAAALAEVFKERWKGFSEHERQALVEDLRSIVKEETLKKRGIRRWGLDDEDAEALSRINLEDSYCSFSTRAIEKLLPHLENGTLLQTAIKNLYPEKRAGSGEPMDELPPLSSGGLGELRNPIVERSLTELRKVVNLLIGRYGKPGMIRVELARELRPSAKEREARWKRMRANERERQRAAEKIAREVGIQNPKHWDIEKVRLAEECNWRCPYTGDQISMRALVGDHPQFDVEHIIPFDRSLDDSFFNKTLCRAEENRKVKQNRTPCEAYSSDPERWEEILQRVRAFTGNGRQEKLRRFQMTGEEVEEFLDGFTSRQLNDTRYAASLAKKYLGLLYGDLDDDGVDPSGKRRVQAVRSGHVTAHLRNGLGLNAVLGGGPVKQRDDHRHHAVDAVVVALTTPRAVKDLSEAARNRGRRRILAPLQPPWEGFLEDVRKAVKHAVVSHRVSKRVRGALHEETFYTRPRRDETGKAYVHLRKPLVKLKKRDLEDIVDGAVRERIKEKLEELGGDFKKLSVPENLPLDARGKKIRMVRVKDYRETFPVGRGPHARFVRSDSNHHMEIVVDGKSGRWEGHVVSMHVAHQRRGRGEPVINRNHGAGKRFLFSLAGGEVIELDSAEGTSGLYVVRAVPQSKQIVFVPINDARKLKDIGREGLTAYPGSLKTRTCRKVTVSPLGEVRDAND